MSSHICAVPNCGRVIKPEYHMCRRHWDLVPRPARDAINFGYFRFVKYNKVPSQTYFAACRAALLAVAEGEGEKEKSCSTIL